MYKEILFEISILGEPSTRYDQLQFKPNYQCQWRAKHK